MKKYILLVMSLLAMVSCDYEETNTNKYGVTDKELGDLIYATAFMEMQQLIIPIGSPISATTPGNHLQNTDLISSGNYIGYFGNNNNWNYSNEANWNFTEERMRYAYKNLYSNLFRAWNSIHSKLKESKDPREQAIMALSDILRIAGWLRATDVFGPIVYAQAGDGDIAPKLDSQEAVYTKMLTDLEKAVNLLNDNPEKVLSKYDAIYGGNPQNWVRLGNSLMLRLAVRVHFKNESLAKEYIAKALNPAKGGTIENKNQEAKIKNSDKMPLMNSMLPSVDDYSETRMGTTIWAYLDGYQDPRIGTYFLKGTYKTTEKYLPLPPTNNKAKSTGVNTAQFASKPKVEKDSPLYWMRASEVFFLKAEAVLYGLASGNAKTFYEEGVRMSFDENGVSGADIYLGVTSKPTDIATNSIPYNTTYSSAISLGNTSPSWNDYKNTDRKEEQFQKIMTQKYLALYPNAVEAWTEYRRTGYPLLTKPADTGAAARINGTDDLMAPERFRFPPSEYSSNPNMSEVATLLGGPDEGATRMWWTRSDRPKQAK